jgi:cholest-4-en-3-one 26-monooxygenase
MSQGSAQEVPVDLSDEQFGVEIPFGTFAALRATQPVYWYENGNCWVVTSYEHVEKINRDPRLFSSAGGPIPPGDPGHPELPIMLADDPPVHTVYRRMVNKDWTPRSVAVRGGLVESVVSDVVGAFREKGSGDFVAEVAGPIPFRIIATMVGIPTRDAHMLWEWTNTLMPSKDPDYRTDPDAPLRASTEMKRYLGELLEDHRKHPRDDLASMVLSLEKEGEPLDDRELRDYLNLFLTGGNETTRHLLTHTAIALASQPDQLNRLLSGEVSVASAVEEMLRWSTPVMHHSRWATADAEIGGAHVRAGDRLTLWMISANRDERVFDHADRLDLARSPNPHITFGGGGPHFCLGVHLARMEAAVAISALLPLFAVMRLEGEPERVWTSFFNGIKRMPVSLG